MPAGVYAIRNRTTGRVYIGATTNTSVRWSMHRTELNRGRHRNPNLQHEWTTLGADTFKFEMLEEVTGDRSELQEAEQRWIERLRDVVYNLRNALFTAPPPVVAIAPITVSAATEAARALAARRPRAVYICTICGQPFDAVVRKSQTPAVCKTPSCQNKRREQTRKPKP